MDCHVGRLAVLTAQTAEISAVIRSDTPIQAAETRPTAAAAIEQQLTKCGGTQFFPRRIDIQTDGAAYVPASTCNALRRAALRELDAQLRVPQQKPFTAPALDSERHTAGERCLYLRFADRSRIPDDVFFTGLPVRRIFLPIAKLTEQIPTAAELCAELPRGMFGKEEALRRELQRVKALGVQTVSVGTLDGLRLAKEEGMTPVCGIGTNLCNTQALRAVEALGARAAMLSFELSLSQATALGGTLPRGLFAYGRVPLMLMRNCPARNGTRCADCGQRGKLTDRMGVEFPIDCASGTAELLNSRPLYLADRQSEICNMDFLYLYFTTETSAQAREILGAFAAGSPPTGEFTRGLYDRGVK